MSDTSTWEICVSSPVGEQRFTLSYDAIRLPPTGSLRGAGGTVALQSLVFNGHSIEFSATVGTPMGPLHLAFSGRMTSDAIEGSCTTMFGTSPFRGQRR